ncbi:hypothetical protein LIX60_29840 [Streptomyces sp. S07_1.15]|uniref:hypothetical protein n=1 Tax=Streptomyces sp. S07_1.15 TaxID=2873925 RepID=UPI001D144905|nr:hypothetical protein [Streptomyces sp. S07_1.15]MCC3655587.1 hypothetical protein [Streptomyces sp. S07_1.15]
MITQKHVRDLLGSPDRQPVLVLLEGREQVVPAAELDGDRYRGAVEIVSRDDLAALITDGDDPSDHELAEVASRLQTLAAERGA